MVMPLVSVVPPTPLVDEVVEVRLAGFPKQQSVTLQASMVDDFQHVWQSQATFVTDAEGALSLKYSAPKSGSYQGVDPMGLFSSMQLKEKLDPNAASSAFFWYEFTKSLSPIKVEITAQSNGEILARTQFTRHFLTLGVKKIDVRAPFIGTLFLPQTPKHTQPVMVFTGSNGGFGWSNQVAAMLASHGFIALAVAYFDWQGQLGLPKQVVELPLEYFEKALTYLKDHANHSDRISVVGVSKGAELALALGAHFNSIERVVAIAPSAYVWEGLQLRHDPHSSWTYQNKPLPFLTYSTEDLFEHFDKTKLRPYHEAAIAKPNSDAALIASENIQGPVLLISGTADSLWPSGPMADTVLQKRKQAGLNYPDQHLTFVNAGHDIGGIPYLPYVAVEQGVDPKRHAQGIAEGWQIILDFLQK